MFFTSDCPLMHLQILVVSGADESQLPSEYNPMPAVTDQVSEVESAQLLVPQGKATER